ncbi:MAG: hypothetical protein ABSB99_03410 [Acidimicrobiales bacterium]
MSTRQGASVKDHEPIDSSRREQQGRSITTPDSSIRASPDKQIFVRSVVNSIGTDRSIIQCNSAPVDLAGPIGIAGLRDSMPNLTGPGPERYHAKPRIARRRLSEPGYRHRHHF